MAGFGRRESGSGSGSARARRDRGNASGGSQVGVRERVPPEENGNGRGPGHAVSLFILIAPGHPPRRRPGCYAHTTRAPAPASHQGEGA
jgi:hypothetical protein